ncbi:hypothetical protein [Nostoc sp.]
MFSLIHSLQVIWRSPCGEEVKVYYNDSDVYDGLRLRLFHARQSIIVVC